MKDYVPLNKNMKSESNENLSNKFQWALLSVEITEGYIY